VVSKNEDRVDMLEEELREMLSFANAAAALVTTRKGALRVMPSREEINGLL
jgi:fructokinase